MHNLHLLVVKSSSAKEACHTVEVQIEDWGTDDNWRTICGAVSEDGEVYVHDKSGRYPPSEDSNTIKKINKMVSGWMKTPYLGENAQNKIEKGETDFTKWEKQELYSLKQYAEYLYQIKDQNVKKFDVLNDEFYNNQYDECGVTQLQHIEHKDGDKIYVVFIDMHS